MGVSFTVTTGITAGGKTFNGKESVSDNMSIVLDPSIAAAQPAALTTRTDATHATLTMTNGGHGLQTGDKVDLYWPGGVIVGALVGTVAGTSVAVSGGIAASGETLLPYPGAATSLTVAKQILQDFSCIGNNLQGLAIEVDTGAECVFCFEAGDHTVLWTPHLLSGRGLAYWSSQHVLSTNPLAGVLPAFVSMTHADAAAPHDMQVVAVGH